MDYTYHKSLMKSEKNYLSAINQLRFCSYVKPHKSLGIWATIAGVDSVQGHIG